MKVQFNTTKKTVTIDDNVTFNELEKITECLFPGYDTKRDYTLMISKLSFSDKSATLIEIPTYKGWDYQPNYPYIKYSGTGGIVLDGKPCNGENYAVTLIDGVYNLIFKF